MFEAISQDGFVGEHLTIASLPFEAATHAEIGLASTCHVVAAFSELDGGFTVVALLPALFLGQLDEFLGRFVLGTIA